MKRSGEFKVFFLIFRLPKINKNITSKPIVLIFILFHDRIAYYNFNTTNMPIEIGTLSQTEQFRKYIDSLPDPEAFRQKLALEATEFKVSLLERALPQNLTSDQLTASLLLNLQQDYDSLITNLPAEFQAKESKSAIHIGNTNQIGIYYAGKIQNGKGNIKSRIACISLHFRDIDGAQTMYLEGVQGELKESKHPRREVRRVFGKLNSYFGEDWRAGLLRQPVKYAYDQGMSVRGTVPGLFSFIATSLPEYPIYSLCYLQTYLRIGVPLEDIEFTQVSAEIQTKWVDAVNFLKTKTQEERLLLLAQATNEYARSYRRLMHQWLREKTIDVPTFDESTKEEYARIFAQHLS